MTRSVSFVNDDGAAFTPDSATYKVMNAAGEELVPETALVIAPGDTATQIVVPAGANAMTGSRAVRVLILTCTTADGTVQVHDSYMLVNATGLELPQDSFVGYWKAIEIAHSRLDTAAFLAASMSAQIAALMQARQILCTLRYRYVNDAQDRVTPRLLFGNLTDVTSSEFAGFPEDFLEALTAAQVVEASQLLAATSDGFSDLLSQLQLLGVQSHKVGESSVSFGSTATRGKPVVSSKAKEILSRYIDTTVRIGRA